MLIFGSGSGLHNDWRPCITKLVVNIKIAYLHDNLHARAQKRAKSIYLRREKKKTVSVLYLLLHFPTHCQPIIGTHIYKRYFDPFILWNFFKKGTNSSCNIHVIIEYNVILCTLNVNNKLIFFVLFFFCFCIILK